MDRTRNQSRRQSTTKPPVQTSSLQSAFSHACAEHKQPFNPTGIEPFAHLPYPLELAIKDSAIDWFWKHHRLGCKPRSIIAAPMFRAYRTTSKRRVIAQRGQVYLSMTRIPPLGPRSDSLLEPVEHARIYNHLAFALQKRFAGIAHQMNFCAIRGTLKERAIVFNVRTLSGQLIRDVRALMRDLAQEHKGLVSGYLFVDPKGSDYYLDDGSVPNAIKSKLIFGDPYLVLKVPNNTYQVSPLGFSQVNESMIPLLIGAARRMLTPLSTDVLVDLYCGYGLFTHAFAPKVTRCIGLEQSAEAITCAAASKHLNHTKNARFEQCSITGQRIGHKLEERPSQGELMIIDPPRSGCGTGVIAACAVRRPRRVLHICCSADEIPRQIREWNNSGYRIVQTTALDMFAGTMNLEIMIALEAR